MIIIKSSVWFITQDRIIIYVYIYIYIYVETDNTKSNILK